MLKSFKQEELIDETDININGDVYRLQERFENKGMRIWEANPG